MQAAAFVGKAVRGVPDAGGRIRRIGVRVERAFKEAARLIEDCFAE